MIQYWRLRRLLSRHPDREDAAAAQTARLDALLEAARPEMEVLAPEVSRQVFEAAYAQSGVGARRAAMLRLASWGGALSTLVGVLGWWVTGERGATPQTAAAFRPPTHDVRVRPASSTPPVASAVPLAARGQTLAAAEVIFLADRLAAAETPVPTHPSRVQPVSEPRRAVQVAMAVPVREALPGEPDTVEGEDPAEGEEEPEEFVAAGPQSRPQFLLVVTGQEPEPEVNSCFPITIRQAEADSPGSAEVTVRHLDPRGAPFWARCTISSDQPSELLLSRAPAPLVCPVPEEEKEK